MDYYNKIVPSSVIVKYSVDILNELSIIANVKQLNDGRDYILFSVDGDVLYVSTDKIDMGVPALPEIQETVQYFREKWSSVNTPEQVYFGIEGVKKQVRCNNVSYTCVISSPLSTSFRFPTPPPLHLSIHNESHTYFQEPELVNDLDVMVCLKKINNIIDQAETESQGTHTTRDKEVIDIIKRIENIPSLPFFNCFFLILLGLLLLALACTWLSYTLFNPTWAESREQRGNHYELLLSVYDVEMLITRVMSKSMSLHAINVSLQNLSNPYYTMAYAGSDYEAESYAQIAQMCQ